MQDNRCGDAHAHLLRCNSLPPDFRIPYLLQVSSAGAAFDNKDYDEFRRIAETMAKEQPNDAASLGRLASAYACQYALHGDPDMRKAAEAKLEEAKKLNDKAFQADNYEERIRHRLATREIIDAKEFGRRFPHGWKPSGKSTT